MIRAIVPSLLIFVSISFPILAQPIGRDDLLVRVVDVGAGLCCVVKMPGDYYMVYDAGRGSRRAFKGISEIIPGDEEIDLMVLSHPDSDHLGAVKNLCDKYRIKRIVRTGYKRPSIDTWVRADRAVRREAIEDGCRDINLQEHEMAPGATYFFGATSVTMVTGFHEPPVAWGLTADNERRNAISIVVRLQYKGKSILFCGDTVGRHERDPEESCIAAEKLMVDRASVITIDSDVMIAPHHGANNGSSKPFIDAVSPEYVIFSAGNMYSHPRRIVAERYLLTVHASKMFRTDWQDKAEGADEWSHDRIQGTDQDDVDIVIRNNGSIDVTYRGSR